MTKDTLYYDGACPICSAEIGKLAKHCGDNLMLRDIHRLPDDDETPGREVLLSRLHLRTADGEWITGLEANVRAWRHTPFRPLWAILEWPLINRVGEYCYEWWLRRRNSGGSR